MPKGLRALRTGLESAVEGAKAELREHAGRPPMRPKQHLAVLGSGSEAMVAQEWM